VPPHVGQTRTEAVADEQAKQTEDHVAVVVITSDQGVVDD
jgi:F0F1-type ATP synthase gamma subunit